MAQGCAESIPIKRGRFRDPMKLYWWCNKHLEKWWSQWFRMTSHIWNGQFQKRFETTNQCFVEKMGCLSTKNGAIWIGKHYDKPTGMGYPSFRQTLMPSTAIFRTWNHPSLGSKHEVSKFSGCSSNHCQKMTNSLLVNVDIPIPKD